MALKISGSIAESVDCFQLDGHFHTTLSKLYDARPYLGLTFFSTSFLSLYQVSL